MYIQSFSYFDYNSNPRGTSTGDCQTRAIATAFNMSWDKVRRILRKYGNDWFNREYNVTAVLKDEFHCKPIKLDLSGAEYLTVGEFCDNQGSRGTYLVLCNSDKNEGSWGSHLVCTINGTIYDTWDSSYCRVIQVYKPTGNHRTENIGDSSDIPDNIYKLASRYYVEFRDQLKSIDFEQELLSHLPGIDPANVRCYQPFPNIDYDKLHKFNFVIDVKPYIRISGDIQYKYNKTKKFNIVFDEDDTYANALNNVEDVVSQALQEWFDAIWDNISSYYEATQQVNSALKDSPKSKALLNAYAGIDPDLKEYVVHVETFCGYTGATIPIGTTNLGRTNYLLVLCKNPKDLSKSIRICLKYNQSFWDAYDTPRINITPYGFTFRLGFYYDTYSADKKDFKEFLETYNDYLAQANSPDSYSLEDYFTAWSLPKYLK